VTWGKKTKTHYLPLSLPQQQKGDKAGLKWTDGWISLELGYHGRPSQQSLTCSSIVNLRAEW
jgi:hypothetical protein